MIAFGLLHLFRNKLKFLIFFFVLSLKSYGQTLDQQQLVYNGGMSARNLAGYSEWQSFTAGMTGNLCQIKMGFFNAINGSGTFKVFSGSGTTGPLLQSQSASISVSGGNYMVTFNVSASVTSGQVYTFQFIPGAGIPDPYGVQVQVPGTYAGGQMGLVDPSGTYFPGFDLVFQTYVCTVLPIELIDFNAKLNKKRQTEITWTAASQLNNDFFTVEKSGDAIHFETLTIIDGAGSTDAVLSYYVIDEHPFNGITYYV
ncbi:MAG TPA: hypothetical protein VE978_12010 [Chitinophagales bacterium]|nr:hypothetical protein [Chitinophagales bacterium]